MISLCNDWEFISNWTEDFLHCGGENIINVRIPHNVNESPLHYSGPDDYEMICGYRKEIFLEESLKGKRIFLQFDAAGHIATVYINGSELATHRCGYTAFRVEITDFVQLGANNNICVKLDCTENKSIPPFGFVIDYLTYGGIYREVWLDIRDQNYIEDVFVQTPSINSAKVISTICGEGDVSVQILDGNNVISVSSGTDATFSDLPIECWNLDNPKLYTCVVTLSLNGTIVDTKSIDFGFRTAEFKSDGFYLNGHKTFLRGLNRHQSFASIGYAATEHLQREDARILKEELQCNAVRTSHYPQSHHFIDECDRLGLLVFTEIPGWQHVGDENWQEQACKNTEEMVLQYRNHPSIVLWGVRINESQDYDDLYRKTNEIAHHLDPTRQTSGVRYLKKSNLLEDVYSFNDFSHSGFNAPVLPKRKVTTDMSKGLLISECNGHMYPTKSFDDWSHRQEQALRHIRVQNGALKDGQHVGCFGWCMFDYQTHKDFGSGNNICYHGVMDIFRNPKLAAASYASQGDGRPVLELGSSMNIGDYPAGSTGSIYAFTNADEVRLYKNDVFVKAYSSSNFNALPHGPMLIDDLVGELLETQEGYSTQQAADIKKGFNAVIKYGFDNLPISKLLFMAYVMKKYHYDFAELYDLYSRYVANWGGESTVWRFDGIKNGEVVISTVCCPGKHLHLEATVSKSTLHEGNTYDMAAIRLQIKDENGNIANYAQLPISWELEGNLELVGPTITTAEGGMSGTYVKTIGKTGTATLNIKSGDLNPISVSFSIN